MKARNENLTSIDAIMDAEFGKPGTPEREEFRKEAYAYCMGQIICDARKKEKMTQSELAEKIGTNKSYISRKEKGCPYGLSGGYTYTGKLQSLAYHLWRFEAAALSQLSVEFEDCQ